MPSEPDKKVEELLKAYARRRRDEAGAPLELHPATRRLLQSEVGRHWSKREPAPRSWLGMSALFWPRLGLALSVLVLLGALAWIFLQFSGEQQQIAQLQREETLSGGLAKASSTPARPEDRKAGEVKSEALKKETPAEMDVVRQKVAKELAPVSQDKDAAVAANDFRRRFADEEARPTTAAPAKPAEALLADAKPAIRAQPLAEAQPLPPAAPAPSQARPIRPTEPTLMLTRSSQPVTTNTAPSTWGGAAVSAENGMALALRDGAAESKAKALPYANAPAVAESKTATLVGTRSTQSAPVPPLETAALSTSAVMSANYLATQTPDTSAPRQLAYGATPTDVPASVRQRLELARVAPESAPGQTTGLSGLDAMSSRKDFYRASDTLKASFAGRSVEDGGFLVSFELEQAGDRIRIVESDGSVYEGQATVPGSERFDERPTDALGKKVSPPAEAAEKGTTSERLNEARLISADMRGSTFRVSGTSRRLNQYVVINGTLFGDTAATQESESVRAQTVSRAAAATPERKAPVASSAPVLSRAGPARSVSADSSRNLGVAGPAPATASQPFRVSTPVRIRGKALIAGTNEVLIDAVRVRP